MIRMSRSRFNDTSANYVARGRVVACCQSRLVNLQLDSLLTGALHQTLVICDVDPEFGTSESLALGT